MKADRVLRIELGADRSAVASVEFALVGVVLVALVLGLYDLTRAYVMWRRLTQAAQSIGEISTKIAVNPSNGTNALSYSQMQTASAAVFPIVPDTNTMARTDFGVALTVVTFAATVPGCTVGCTYKASTMWSSTPYGTQPGRVCGTLTSVPDGQAFDPTTLPASAFQAASMLVVDVTAVYTPVLIAYITGPIKLTRSAYLPPRSGAVTDWIRVSGVALPGQVRVCP